MIDFTFRRRPHPPASCSSSVEAVTGGAADRREAESQGYSRPPSTRYSQRGRSARLSSRKNLEPGANVIGMAHGRQDAERRADESARYFRHQFLRARVGLRNKKIRWIPTKSGGRSTQLTEFVKSVRAAVDRLEIGLWRRNPARSRRRGCKRLALRRCGILHQWRRSAPRPAARSKPGGGGGAVSRRCPVDLRIGRC